MQGGQVWVDSNGNVCDDNFLTLILAQLRPGDQEPYKKGVLSKKTEGTAVLDQRGQRLDLRLQSPPPPPVRGIDVYDSDSFTPPPNVSKRDISPPLDIERRVIDDYIREENEQDDGSYLEWQLASSRIPLDIRESKFISTLRINETRQYHKNRREIYDITRDGKMIATRFNTQSRKTQTLRALKKYGRSSSGREQSHAIQSDFQDFPDKSESSYRRERSRSPRSDRFLDREETKFPEESYNSVGSACRAWEVDLDGKWTECDHVLNQLMESLPIGGQSSSYSLNRQRYYIYRDSQSSGRQKNMSSNRTRSLRATQKKECPFCTFRNHPDLPRCEMCFNPMDGRESNSVSDCYHETPNYHSFEPPARRFVEDIDLRTPSPPPSRREENGVSSFSRSPPAHHPPQDRHDRSFRRDGSSSQFLQDRERRGRDSHRNEVSLPRDRHSPLNRQHSGRRHRPVVVWQYKDDRSWKNCNDEMNTLINKLGRNCTAPYTLGRNAYTVERINANTAKQTNDETSRKRNLRAALKCKQCGRVCGWEDLDCSRCHSAFEVAPIEMPRGQPARNEDPLKWKGPTRRNKPVHGKELKTVYHCTDKNAVDAIKKSGNKMLRGQSGMFGGGIYFAETKRAAHYKAHKRGYIIHARVFVGRAKVVSDHTAGQFTFGSLYDDGFDSVYAPQGAGNGAPEVVVYNADQVKIIRIEKNDGTGWPAPQWSGGGGLVSGP